MTRQDKTESKPVTEKNTKGEILKAYQGLLEQITSPEEVDSTPRSEKVILDSAKNETIEKIVNDLSQLKLSANQTINVLSEKLTQEAERLSDIRKAIDISEQELEEIHNIKARAGILQRMVEIQKQQESEFSAQMNKQHTEWEDEQKEYEQTLKRERTREEEEYAYQLSTKKRRDSEQLSEERKNWEKEKQVRQQVEKEQEVELTSLREQVTQFPKRLEKAIEDAVRTAVEQAKKEAQIDKNFAKQESENRTQLAQMQVNSLESTVTAQKSKIEALERQLADATKQIKDIAVTVINSSQRETLELANSSDAK